MGAAMTTFIGLDLAWTSHRETGICVFADGGPDGLRCVCLETGVRRVEDVATDIAKTPGTVVVAVDAPLIVTHKRWVEREIGRRFGRYKAPAHSANLDLLKRTGRTAGMDLGMALEKQGIALDLANLLGGGHEGRWAVEVYPHTIHVRLFALDQRLPYKQKKGRRVGDRRIVFCRYQSYLKSVLHAEAPGVLQSPDLQRTLSHSATMAAKGMGLKRLEDKLDAVTCVLAAYLLWRHPFQWEMLGNLDGYVVVPRGAVSSSH